MTRPIAALAHFAPAVTALAVPTRRDILRALHEELFKR